jgi:hypothetical protein
MSDRNILTLRQSDQARTDFALLESQVEVIAVQLARLPTRGDLALTALGIIFCTAVIANVVRLARLALATGARGAKLNVPPDLGANVDAHHHCDLCCPGSSVRYLGASHSLAPKQSRFNRTHYLSPRASGGRMRVRISAHPLAGSVGPLAFGPLHFKDAQESFSRKHAQLGVSAT